jgi:short chain dehydrogenase
MPPSVPVRLTYTCVIIQIDTHLTGMPKTVLITGATSGLGRAAATRFAAAGWRVIAKCRARARHRASAACRFGTMEADRYRQVLKCPSPKLGKNIRLKTLENVDPMALIPTIHPVRTQSPRAAWISRQVCARLPTGIGVMLNAPFGTCKAADLAHVDPLQSAGGLVAIDKRTKLICACS